MSSLIGNPLMLMRALNHRVNRSYTRKGPGRMPHRKTSNPPGSKHYRTVMRSK